MELRDWGAAWQELSEEAISGMKEWRLQNPKATFAEIETELDLRLAKLRARMLQDTALASSAADWSGNQLGEGPECPDCGRKLAPSGKRRRRLQTLGGTRDHAGTPVWGLPGLRRETFPPWMKSWNCCRAA